MGVNRKWLCNEFINSLSLEIPMLKRETALARGVNTELQFGLGGR